MSKPEDLITYLLLEYVSALDFISNELAPVKSSLELSHLGHSIVRKSIARFGYDTHLNYEDIARKIWPKLSRSDIFCIKSDTLFGERVDFNIDAYRTTAEDLKVHSESYKLIREMIDQFGSEGFRRALVTVAESHGWNRRASEGEKDGRESDGYRTAATTATFNQAEIVKLGEEILGAKKVVEDSSLNQSDKAQALAFLNAAYAMVESPNPPWATIRDILYMVAAISTVLEFVIIIAEKIA